MDKTNMVSIKNRSAGMCVYSVPELHVRRQLAPGQTIMVPRDEIEKLMYRPGGKEMLTFFLQVQDTSILTDYNIEVEPEYNMSEKDVIELINNGSIDEFMDVLDFAPAGVIDLIKTYAVSLPMNDANKRIALKKATDFDVDAAIRHNMEDKEEEQGDQPTEQKKQRRVKKTTEADAEPTGRRVQPKKYEVVSDNE